MMRKVVFQHVTNIALLLVTILVLSVLPDAHATSIFLDGDTPATGSNLDTTPLVTPFGTITFLGELSPFVDDDFTAAGASGRVRSTRTATIRTKSRARRCTTFWSRAPSSRW